MGFLEERDLSDVPSIPEFFKGKTIFITGGTGFMGKVLIEKLLYSCSELDRVYLLMRSKKGVSPEDRLAQLYSSALFDRLRREKPTLFESKVFCINGDVMEPGLGLSDEDRALLVNRVNIVFHAAASVRFDDSLRKAVNLNLKGAEQVMDLAKDMRDLCVLLHVSTAYCNTNHHLVDEVLYPPLANWRDTLQVCDALDDHTLDVLTTKYLGPLPNTYTFTKHLAEHVVCEAKGQIPVVIVRPSIVVSSLEEPVPGWVENFNGPVGIMTAYGKGLLRTLFIDPDVRFDYIPVDISIKSIITAAWLRGTKKLESSDDVPIYHSCMNASDRVNVIEIAEMGLKFIEEKPFKNTLWTPTDTTTTSELMFIIQNLLFHLLPAIFVDTILRIMGKKPMLLKIQRRIYVASYALRYFMTQNWIFDIKNLVQLRSCIKKEDHQQFYFHLKYPDIEEYFVSCCMGAQTYLLKEDDSNLHQDKITAKRMWVLDKVVKFVFYVYLIKFIYIHFVANYVDDFLFN